MPHRQFFIPHFSLLTSSHSPHFFFRCSVFTAQFSLLTDDSPFHSIYIQLLSVQSSLWLTPHPHILTADSSLFNFYFLPITLNSIIAYNQLPIFAAHIPYYLLITSHSFAPLTVHSSPLISSLRNAHISLLTRHCAIFINHYSLLNTHGLKLLTTS